MRSVELTRSIFAKAKAPASEILFCFKLIATKTRNHVEDDRGPRRAQAQAQNSTIVAGDGQRCQSLSVCARARVCVCVCVCVCVSVSVSVSVEGVGGVGSTTRAGPRGMQLNGA